LRHWMFDRIAHFTVHHNNWSLAIVLVVTLILGALSGRLRMEMTWIDLVPKSEPPVREFENIVENYGSLTPIIVTVEGPSEDRVKQGIRELAPRIEAIDKYVAQVNYQVNRDYVLHHGFMLLKERDLARMRRMLSDLDLVPLLTHINDDLESEYVADKSNLVRREREAIRSLDGIMAVVEAMGRSAAGPVDTAAVKRAVDLFTLGETYYLSDDKKMALLLVKPVYSTNDLDHLLPTVNTIENTVRAYAKDNPDLKIGLTGMHVIFRDEMETGMSDTYRNLVMAFVLILILFSASFHMWVAPLLAMAALLVGIIWDMGIAAAVIGRLNIMTAMTSVILVGLGVDYAIHIIAAYTELRGRGEPLEAAVKGMFSMVGNGVLTGALTTTIAFLMLIFTSFRMLQEIGFVTGVGIITCLLATLILLPALLVLRDRLRERLPRKRPERIVDLRFLFLGRITTGLTRFPIPVLAAAAILTLFLLWRAQKITFDQNPLHLEAKGLESIRLEDELTKRFYFSSSNMVMSAKSLAEAERITDQLNEQNPIGLVESLSLYLPSREKQERRAPLIRKLRSLVARPSPGRRVDVQALSAQVERLEANIIEIGSLAYSAGLDRVFNLTNHVLGWNEQGEEVGPNRLSQVMERIKKSGRSAAGLTRFQELFAGLARPRLREMANPSYISLDDVPREIRERYMSKDGKEFLVLIFPRESSLDDVISGPFTSVVERYAPRATGMLSWLRIIYTRASREGKVATILAFLAITILLLLDFRRPDFTLLAMIPLVMSAICMVGIMQLIGYSFNFLNVVAVPLILGIGIDDGVHIIHRYRKEGCGSLALVMSSTGKAILLTSLTTMLAFGSLAGSLYRGYVYFGVTMFIGVGLCFLASAFVLPPLLALIYERRGRRAR